MDILIANERLLFRFGVDRVLILLGQALKKSGNEVVVLANDYDYENISSFASKIIDVPVNTKDYLHQNESTSTWLEKEYINILPDFSPDIVLLGGWPFFTSIPFFNGLGAKTVFMDCGAVPLDGFDEGQTLIQAKLRKLRKTYLQELSLIIAISDFIANSQSLPDSRGQIAILSVLLAADHMKDLPIETQQKSTTIDKIKKLKDTQTKFIFSLGRWEPDNYKNSTAAFDIFELVRYKHPDARLMILGHEEDLNIPGYLKGLVIPVGFPSDSELLELMHLSDTGIIVSKWEGFNLPLAEMQSIEKPTFVFNLAAHPEVVVHPWFLCEYNEEMAKKISLFFSNQLSIVDNIRYRNFNNFFKWDRVVIDYQKIFESIVQIPATLPQLKNKLPYDNLQVIIDVSNSCLDPANSGVIRVTRRFSAQLQKRITPVFVLWDRAAREYIFPEQSEYERLGTFHGPLREEKLPMSENGKRELLSDYLTEHPCRSRWLILPELFSEKDGVHIRHFSKKHSLFIASIFYDAIPVLYPGFCNNEVKDNHTKYMDGLSKCDVIIPISSYSSECLKDFWQERGVKSTEVFTDELPGEFGGIKRAIKIKEPSHQIKILCVSTLEPRKNHVTLLKAIKKLEEKHPDLDFKLTLVGNRYAGAFDIAENIESICQNNSKIEWLGPISDEELIEVYKQADFTIYPSIIEGFGMPVLESIWYAKPCICSSKGTMSDLAKDGGCLTVDILDDEKLSYAIYQLSTDTELLKKLANEAIHREIKSWKEYTDFFLGILLSQSKITHTYTYDKDEAVIENKKVLICCNAYPPDFIGGAELIAHYQALELQKQGYCVKVFTGDTHSNKEHYSILKDVYEGIEIYRVRLIQADFSSENVNFSNPEVEKHFKLVLKEFQPAILHMHNIIGLSVLFPAIAKNNGVKTFLTLHDGWGFCYKNTMMQDEGKFCNNFKNCSGCLPSLFDKIDRNIPMVMRQDYFPLALEDVDMFISPSYYLRDQYIKAGFDEDKIKVLSNGIDIDCFNIHKEDDKNIRFTFIGYLGEHKGVDLILKALKHIQNKNGIKINIVGDGYSRETLETYVKKENLSKYVAFFGKVDNKQINKIFAQTDVYILPSMWPENQPVSITEAFASRVPVIGTDFGGIKELITNKKTGLLFPMGDISALAESIQYFILNPKKIYEFGENAYKFIKDKSFKTQVSKLIEEYESLSLVRHVEKPFVVSCIGKQVSSVAFETILKIKNENHSIYFVMHEWLDSFKKFESNVIWVVDSSMKIEEIINLNIYQKPFLFPEKPKYFKKICLDYNNGLYYDDTDTAIECIYYLFKHRRDSYLLGENKMNAKDLIAC